MTEEEKEEIIALATERTLLMIPEVIGNLMQKQAIYHKMNSEFYSKHKEFVNHKDTVASVIEQLQGKNPLKDYEEVLKDAIPIIKERIRVIGSMDTSKVNPNPSRTVNGVI